MIKMLTLERAGFNEMKSKAQKGEEVQIKCFRGYADKFDLIAVNETVLSEYIVDKIKRHMLFKIESIEELPYIPTVKNDKLLCKLDYVLLNLKLLDIKK